MAFPERSISNSDMIPQSCMISAVKKPATKFKKDKVCILNGKKGYTTEECWDIQKLEKLGWKNSAYRTINSCNMEDDLEDGNKNSLNYSGQCSKENPFYKRICINGGKKHWGLIDTGADVSIINKNNLSNKIQIKDSKQVINATTGNPLKIIGKVET